MRVHPQLPGYCSTNNYRTKETHSIAHRVCINLVNTWVQGTGWTALTFAVDEGHKDIVQRLVSAGADVHIRDKVCGDMESVCRLQGGH